MISAVVFQPEVLAENFSKAGERRHPILAPSGGAPPLDTKGIDLAQRWPGVDAPVASFRRTLESGQPEKPDAHIIGDQVANLEAEHATLSKPEKVLKNLERATEQDRECVFIVQEPKLERLQDILRDVDEDQYRILVSTDLGVTEP